MASFGDFNRVNTNVTALSAQLSLNKINSELGDSRLKLSTGKRINSVEDDSAGYAIATKLNSRVKGLEQALQNVSDAKSVLNIIESSYNSIMDNLIEMKRLANQAANDTISSAERTLIAKQINGLSIDINSVADSTKFNGISLLPAANNDSLTFHIGEATNETMVFEKRQVGILGLFGPDDVGLGLFNMTDINVEVDAGNLTIMDQPRGQIDFEINVDNEVIADGWDFRIFMNKINTAISTLNGYNNELGIKQRSLSSKEENLTQAITANSAAHSRIMDTDFAKEQSNSIRLQILQQTATAALSQANMGPQAVLGFLGQ